MSRDVRNFKALVSQVPWTWSSGWQPSLFEPSIHPNPSICGFFSLSILRQQPGMDGVYIEVTRKAWRVAFSCQFGISWLRQKPWNIGHCSEFVKANGFPDYPCSIWPWREFWVCLSKCWDISPHPTVIQSGWKEFCLWWQRPKWNTWEMF